MRNYNSKNIAVLIFALSQEEEQKNKPLFSNKALASLLNTHVKNTVEKTGLDYFIFSEKEQLGNNFGERFSNAIASIYKKGYNAVITVGNDSPGLNKNHLLKTAELLQKNSFVIGPSKDGGFYLMGLQKEYFNKKEFTLFCWNTSSIRKEIKSYIRSFTASTYTLNYLNDIDTFFDLKKLYTAGEISINKFIAIITKLISTFTSKIVSNSQVKILLLLYKVNYNKGSPFNLYN